MFYFGLGSRIRDVEAFWYKTEIKIIYFVRLCVLVWFTLTLNFWYVKPKKRPHFFSEFGSWFYFDLMLSGKTFATNSFQRRTKTTQNFREQSSLKFGGFVSKLIYKFLPAEKLVHLSGYFFQNHIGGGLQHKNMCKISYPQRTFFWLLAELFFGQSTLPF